MHRYLKVTSAGVRHYAIALLALMALSLSPARAVDPPACPDTLDAMALALVSNAPVTLADDDASHGDYVMPSMGDVDALAAAFAPGLGADIGTMETQAATLGLDHCLLSLATPNGNEDIDVWYPPDGFDAMTTRGLPLLALRRTIGTRPVILGVPHAATEYRIAAQGVAVFTGQPAVTMLVIAPQHRCHLADIAPAAFQGSTDQCDGVYRESDAAHTQQSLFHALHRGAWSAWPTAITLQIHGMSAAGISASPGKKGNVAPASDWPATALHDRYAAGLEALGFDPATLTTCVDYTGPRGDRVREHLCGTKNAQRGGLADLTRERDFIHLEQSRNVREEPGGDDALATAAGFAASAIWRDSFEQ